MRNEEGGTPVVYVPWGVPDRSKAESRRNEGRKQELGSDEHPQADAPCWAEPRAEHQAQNEHGKDEDAGLKGGALEPVEEDVRGHGRCEGGTRRE